LQNKQEKSGVNCCSEYILYGENVSEMYISGGSDPKQHSSQNVWSQKQQLDKQASNSDASKTPTIESIKTCFNATAVTEYYKYKHFLIINSVMAVGQILWRGWKCCSEYMLYNENVPNMYISGGSDPEQHSSQSQKQQLAK